MYVNRALHEMRVGASWRLSRPVQREGQDGTTHFVGVSYDLSFSPLLCHECILHVRRNIERPASSSIPAGDIAYMGSEFCVYVLCGHGKVHARVCLCVHLDV